MSYSLATIWHERSRFIPAILAVAFSALLIALQAGLLLGLLSMMSTPVDRSMADVWVGYPGVQSVDLGRPIPEAWEYRLAQQPEVDRVEPCLIGFALWSRPGDGLQMPTPEVCTVVGTDLSDESLGLVQEVRSNPEFRARLAEPGAIIVDESELGRLGSTGVGDRSQINGVTVHVVGLVKGLKSLGGAYVFCSFATARRMLIMFRAEEVTYWLGRCRDPQQARAVVERMRQYPFLGAFSHDEFSLRTRIHWLTTTKAGIAMAFTAVLGLLVGAVVTSQTLYAATAASQREYATLRAMGIPRWRLKLSVMTQSMWVGVLGIILAVPITLTLAEAANLLGTQVLMPWWISIPSVLVTLLMALLSGLAALRTFQGVDPAHNLR